MKITEWRNHKNSFWNAGLYFLGSIAQGVFAMIAQPLYSLNMSAADFGILGFFEAVKGFFLPIFILSVPSVYLMRYFRDSDDINKRNLFNLTFFWVLFNSLTIFLGHFAIYAYFQTMDVRVPLNPYSWFILIALMLENFKSMVLINFRIRKMAINFFVFSIVNTLLNFIFGLSFVVLLKWGVEGRMIAPVVSSLVLLPYCVFMLRKYSTFHIDFKNFRKSLKTAFPLIAASYAYFPIQSIDRFFLERINNLPELGLYNLGLTFAGYTQLVLSALILAFEPDIFKSTVDKAFGKLMKYFLLIYVPFGLFTFIFVIASKHFVGFLTAGRYVGASYYTNLAVIAYFILGIFSFFDRVFVATEKPKFNLFTNLVGSIFAICVTYLFVALFGFPGAAFAKIAVASALLIVSFYLFFFHVWKVRIS